MSDVKISELASAAALDGTEELAIVQSGSTVKDTLANVIALKELGVPVPDSVAVDVATLVADYNSLLASLRAANIIGT